MKLRLGIVGSIALATAPGMASAQWLDNCDYEAERSGTVDAAGADSLELIARAGTLVIEGRSGLAEVRVRGRVCASDESLLDEIDLVTERRGDEVHVEVVMDEDFEWRDNSYLALHLVVEAPGGMAANVTDSSGSIEIEGLGDLSLTDGSGSIQIDGIEGSVRIRDGSGSITVANASGDVEIEDGSGSVDVRDIGGSVDIDDGSGSLELQRVAGSVELVDGSGSITGREIGGDFRVRRDGSGSIDAVDVTGDLIVERDGSGGLSFRRIGGEVRASR